MHSSLSWESVQWAASLLGMLGAIPNAIGGRVARLTWPLWIASNLLAIAALAKLGAYGFLTKELFFTLTSLVGATRVFFPSLWRQVVASTRGLCRRPRPAMRSRGGAETGDESGGREPLCSRCHHSFKDLT